VSDLQGPGEGNDIGGASGRAQHQVLDLGCGHIFPLSLALASLFFYYFCLFCCVFGVRDKGARSALFLWGFWVFVENNV